MHGRPIGRRGLAAAAAALLARSAGAMAGGRKRREPPADNRPNIVLVITDDMRATDWRALPRTQRELADARMYPNHVIDCPLCGPSRATILTGQYAHNHGVRWNENEGDPESGGYAAWRRNKLDRRTVNVELQGAGYRTGLIGKFFAGELTIRNRPKGWDRWVATIKHSYSEFPLDIDGEVTSFRRTDYLTDVLARFAVEFIETTPASQPLFLFFGAPAPHNGPETGRPVPASRHRKRFATSVVERTAGFNEANVDDKPATVAALPLLTPEGVAAADLLERDRLRSLLAVDDAIVEIISTLRRTGRLDNTCIFITSDNGFQLGQHRISNEKAMQYRESVLVPMLAWGKPFAGGEDNRLVATCDLAPTIAALARTPLRTADGMSLVKPGVRDFALVELQPPSAAYRTRGWGLRSQALMYFEHDNGEREFYDLRADPAETRNLLAPVNAAEPWPGDLPGPMLLSGRLGQLRICRGTGCLLRP
ncbi:MAG: sulfatase [Chloroflexota bacterium]